MRVMIFKTWARKYFELGIAVIPLNGKIPIIKNWQRWSTVQQTEAELNELIDKFPNANIGAVLGLCLCALDIDTDDIGILRACPYTPLKRKGAKGAALLFAKSYLENMPGSTYPVEFLNVGRQIVLPPSIHPDTKKPYMWIGDEDILTFNLSELPTISELDIKKILSVAEKKKVFVSHAKHLTNNTEKSGRNNYLTKAGYALAVDGLSLEAGASRLLELDAQKNTPPWFTDTSEQHKSKKPYELALSMYQRALEAATKLGDRIETNFASLPAPLPSCLPTVPTLDTKNLPEPLSSWVISESKRLQVAPEMIATPLLVSLGITLGTKVSVKPKRLDSWHEYPTLWSMTVASPSTRKTCAQNSGLSFIRELSKQKDLEYKKALSKFLIKEKTLLVQLKYFENSLKQAIEDGASVENIENEIQKITVEIERLKPKHMRLTANDSTVEKLGEILIDNPGGVLVFRDEIAGFFTQLSKSGREGDREFFLESFNGKNEFRVDRISRGTLVIPNLKISICGSTQPNKIYQTLKSASSGKSEDDGLFNRFQLLAFPEDTISSYVDFPKDEELDSEVKKIFQVFDNFIPTEILKLKIEFDDSTQELYKEWSEKLELKKRSETIRENPFYIQHLGKFGALVAKLSLLFELVKLAHSNSENFSMSLYTTKISKDSLSMAINWCGFLESHFEKLIALFRSPGLTEAHRIADKIKKGLIKDNSNVRSIYRNGWTGLNTEELVMNGLETLENYAWLRIEQLDRSGQGRNSRYIKLNPQLNLVTDIADKGVCKIQANNPTSPMSVV